MDAAQLGLTDVPELVLGHGDHALTLGHQLAAVTHKLAVLSRKGLQDLTKQIKTQRSITALTSQHILN